MAQEEEVVEEEEAEGAAVEIGNGGGASWTRGELEAIVEVRFDALRAPGGPDWGVRAGYPIYSQIMRVAPSIHGDAKTQMALWPDALVLRTSRDKVGALAGLEGAVFDVRARNAPSGRLVLGRSSVRALEPCPDLMVRSVNFKSSGRSAEGVAWARSLRRRLDDLGVRGRLAAELTPEIRMIEANVYCRGRGLILRGLSTAQSLVIQRVGMGSRTRFGWGMARPLGEVSRWR